MSDKNFGSPGKNLIIGEKNKKISFTDKIKARRKVINWSIVVVFFISFLFILIFSLAPIFSIKNKIAPSSFGNDVENKIIEDYYRLPESKDRDLPFKEFDLDGGGHSDIEILIDNELSDLKGTYGVYAKNTDTGEEIKIRQEDVFTAASLTKLFVVGAYYEELKQNPNFQNNKIVLREKDRIEGAGSVSKDPDGTIYSPNVLVRKMLKESDNTAFSMMIRFVGFNKIINFIEENDFSETDFENNTTSPKDIEKFLEYLYNKKLFGEYYSNEILEMMKNTFFEDRIPYYLPTDLEIAHKVGSWTGAYSDAGIIYGGSKSDDYILVVMTEDAYYEEGINAIRKLSKIIYQHFGGEW